jgi:alkylation response protein AidB-like acyl-CoA dehydrogenase
MKLNHQEILTKIEAYLKTEIHPFSTKIDQNSIALKQALKKMGEHQFLALKVPQKWGGQDFTSLDYSYFAMMIARYSGALAFLQTQHQSAAAKLAVSDNELLKNKYLGKMATGEILIGVGFSQLRRQGQPLMKARPIKGGYKLTGEVPWVTGFDFFQSFIVGAILPDGKEIYGILPLENREEIIISPPQKLIAMSATNTVSITINQWLLKAENILMIKPAGTIKKNDLENVLHHGFFALGCAEAALDILESVYEQKQLNFVQEAKIQLRQKVSNCCQKMLNAVIGNQSFPEKLTLRAEAIKLAGLCAQAAVTVSSGAANYWEHPAGRIYRESLVFTVFGQTLAVMEATLQQLVN